MSASAIATPANVEVVIALCRADPRLSDVKLVVDLPGAPQGLGVALDRNTALLIARDIKAACAVIERIERARDDA